jgi:hypothetical protein
VWCTGLAGRFTLRAPRANAIGLQARAISIFILALIFSSVTAFVVESLPVFQSASEQEGGAWCG